jgi:hypothetical protein
MEHDWMRSRGPLDEDDKRRLVLELVAQLHCTECEQPYDLEDFALVHHWEDLWVLSARCGICDQVCHVVIYMQLDAAPEPAVDLTPEEIEVAGKWPPITADDVLDVHLLLQQFDGDLEMLLNS